MKIFGKSLSFGKRKGVGLWFGSEAPSKEDLTDFIKLYIKENAGNIYGNSPKVLEQIVETLYDFRGWNGGGSIMPNDGQELPFGSVVPGTPPEKIAKKPVEVKDELTYQPYKLAMEGLDEKIALCERKRSMVTQHYAVQELDGIIERLKLRLKYSEFQEFFDKFPYTTDEKIEDLLTKYKLRMSPIDIYVGDFPEEAIQVMHSYTEEVKKLCGKQPVYLLIAEESAFKAAYKKKDPILLVQSPFCFNWQILGAWDKEMLLLSEL